MKTTHNIIFQDAQDLKEVASESVDLIVTSPPYPMGSRHPLPKGRGLGSVSKKRLTLPPQEAPRCPEFSLFSITILGKRAILSEN